MRHLTTTPTDRNRELAPRHVERCLDSGALATPLRRVVTLVMMTAPWDSPALALAWALAAA